MIESDPAFKVVGEAGDGKSALIEVRRLKPDLAIVDLKMPGLDGLDVIPRIGDLSHGKTATVVFSMYDNPAYVRAAIAAGARAYILKSIDKEELFAALRAVSEGRAFIQPQLAPCFVKQELLQETSIYRNMSVREEEVLNLVADGLTNREIAERLAISEETVKTHLKRLYQKLGASDRTEAVAIALRQRII